MKSKLYAGRAQLLEQCVHAMARIVLHVTGDSRMSHGDVRAATALLKELIYALDNPEAYKDDDAKVPTP